MAGLRDAIQAQSLDAFVERFHQLRSGEGT